ncbi:MAG: hypothetical protein HY795_05235 [Desulfovibrio sp.]|nr:hypothetical protein [Desulfovibrio sp.]MBI4959237.1 hypothetical protein [Desulfovibrio sp.]
MEEISFLEFLEDFGKRDDLGGSLPSILEELTRLQPYYLLWAEYLKRSIIYKETVEWVNNVLKNNPDLDCLNNPFDSFGNYTTILDLSSAFRVLKIIYTDARDLQLNYNPDNIFEYAIYNKFPHKEELIFTYIIFGDVFSDEYIENFTKPTGRIYNIARMFVYRHDRIKRKIIDMNDKKELQTTVNCSIEMFEDKYGKKPSIDDLYTVLHEWFSESNNLFVEIDIVGLSNKQIFNQIKDLINSHKDKIKYEQKHSLHDSFQFQHPTVTGNLEELRRYLRAFDLKKEGKTIREISSAIYERDLDDDVRRVVLRDIDKAKRIIANAEIGLFPGKY